MNKLVFHSSQFKNEIGSYDIFNLGLGSKVFLSDIKGCVLENCLRVKLNYI